MKLFSRLAALVGAVAFLVTGFALTPASAKTKIVHVHSYTRHMKNGKTVHVHGYTRKVKTGNKMVKVHSYTRMTKMGKMVHVKSHMRIVKHSKKPMSKMHM